MQSQSRLKKNSGIDRSSSMSGVTNAKLGQSKTASKQEASLYSAPKQHGSQAQRDHGPSQYLSEKQGSSLGNMKYQNANYLAGSSQ